MATAELPPAWSAALDAFAAECRARGYARPTLRRLAGDARRAAAFWTLKRGRIRPADLTADDLAAWYAAVAQREDAGQLGPTAARAYARAADGLLTATGDRALTERAAAVDFAHVRASVLGALAAGDTAALPHRATWTRREVEALYDVTAAGSTERAVLALAYGCGLRRAECASVAVRDVRTADATLVVERGKGGRRRTVPLAPAVAADLNHYAVGDRTARIERLARREGTEAARDIDRAPAGSGGFLVNQLGRPMRPATVATAVARIVTSATDNGLVESVYNKRATCHGLRHAVATHLLGTRPGHGLTLEQVRRFLGHRSIQTTQQYVAVDPIALQRLVP